MNQTSRRPSPSMSSIPARTSPSSGGLVYLGTEAGTGTHAARAGCPPHQTRRASRNQPATRPVRRLAPPRQGARRLRLAAVRSTRPTPPRRPAPRRPPPAPCGGTTRGGTADPGCDRRTPRAPTAARRSGPANRHRRRCRTWRSHPVRSGATRQSRAGGRTRSPASKPRNGARAGRSPSPTAGPCARCAPGTRRCPSSRSAGSSGPESQVRRWKMTWPVVIGATRGGASVEHYPSVPRRFAQGACRRRE